jgi:hypothetical protein
MTQSIRANCISVSVYILVTLGAYGCTKSSGTTALEKQKEIEAKKRSEAEASSTEQSTPKSQVTDENIGQPLNNSATDEATDDLPAAAKPDPDYELRPVSECSEDSEIAEALAKLAKTGKQRSMREKFERLKNAGKPAIRGLIAAMKADNPNIRTQAALILRRMEHKSSSFTNALNTMLLSDPDADVRGIAGRVMVYYLNKKTVPALMDALEKDGAEAVRMHAAWALGAIKDRRALGVLFTALDDESTDVRLRTVGALKRIRSKKALPHLVSRLDDSNSLVRTRALEALERLSGKKLGKKSAAWRAKYPLKQ